MARMNIKTLREKIGRMKIARLLWLMRFHDDDPAATEQIMRQRLRRIQEQTRASSAHKKRSTVRKITFKCGGKTFEMNPSNVPLETPCSELTEGHNDDMDIDSSNLSSEDHSSNMINDADQSFEEIRLQMIKENNGNEDGAMELNNGDNMDIKDFIRSIGGSEAELVIQKTLTKSDCDKNQGRLLIPVLQVKNHGFLTINEKTQLGIRKSISVDVFDPERRKLTLNLAQWKMKNENYVLKTNWKKLVHTNGLKDNMKIQVLSFRVDQKLCFAVVRV